MESPGSVACERFQSRRKLFAMVESFEMTCARGRNRLCEATADGVARVVYNVAGSINHGGDWLLQSGGI